MPRNDKYIQNWPEPFKTQMKQIVEVSPSCLSDKIHDFIDILDTLPRHKPVTRTKRQFDLVTFGVATTGLKLATYNAAQISKLESKIAANKNKLDHLIDITNLNEQHFKAMDSKLDYISKQAGDNAPSQQSPFCKNN
jgi:hypothetical protein